MEIEQTHGTHPKIEKSNVSGRKAIKIIRV